MVALAVIRPDQPGGGVTHARVNWSRWIADCPHPYCRGAVALEPEQRRIQCVEPWCGAEAAVIWPANQVDIEYLLAVRPDPITRNWEPGETVHDLLQENIEHGVVPPAWLESSDGPALAIMGDRIVAGRGLPARIERRAIGA